MRAFIVVFGLFITSNFVYGETIYFDASGRSGIDGAPGASYDTSSGASSGTGHNGGNAGSSTPGQDAQNIDLNLKQIEASTGSATLVITGTVRKSGINSSLELNSSTLVSADAHGGKGGDGGKGGHGQGGCNGTNGMDASQYSSGTNGGPGCNAGDGGDGTPGSHGGEGGSVRAKVKINETHLFLAFTCDVSGGAGGRAGQNGNGGQGGTGGRGGSSYSWSESVYDGEECSTTSSSNGNGSYSTSRSCRSKYRTEYHSNAGGSNGFDGSDGSHGKGNVAPGQNGRSGSCVYLVEDANGASNSYQNKFTLTIKSFSLYDANRDGVIEPGEKVFVENIVVQNGDGVPSPAGKAKLSLFVNSARFIMAEPVQLELPQIFPHATYKVPGKLPLTVRDTQPSGKELRWQEQDTIDIDNSVTVVDRAVPGFNSQRTIQITYPIELTRFEFPNSAAAGEDRPVVWAIKNISGRDFGGASEMERMVAFHFQSTGGLAKNDSFTLTDDRGQALEIQHGFLREILRLKSGEEIRIEGRLHVPSEVLPYTDLAVQSDLLLGNPKARDPRTIQQKIRTLRIAQTFNPNSSADVVLVTNRDTQRTAFVAWQQVFEKLNLRYAVWDLSYYGYMSLLKDFEGSQSNFKKYLSNKTMIILNDSFESGEMVSDHLERDEFLDVAANSNARFLILGGKPQSVNNLIHRLVTPENRGPTFNVKSSDSFNEQKLPEHIGQALTMNLIRTYYFWNSPKPSDVQNQVERWNAYVKNMKPRDKFTFSYFFSPSALNDNWYSTTYQIGQIQVGRTLTSGGGLALAMPLQASHLHDPQFILSEELFRAVILALPPSKVLQLTALYDLQKPKIGYWLQDALIYNAISEIDREEVFFNVGGTPPEENRWPFFKNLLGFGKDHTDSQTALLMGNIGAAVDFYKERIPLLSNFNLSRRLSKLRDEMENVINKTYMSLYDSNRKAFLKKLESKFEKRKKLLVDLKDRENARHMVMWPAIYRLNSTEIMLENNLIKQGYSAQEGN